MYVPRHFSIEDHARMVDFMRCNSFALLTTCTDTGPFVSHLPLLHVEGGAQGKLIGHMARANPQWRHFASGKEALVVFWGPHAYISPAWYDTPNQVPTWNYTAVHAYGVPKVLSDPKVKHESQRRLVAALDPQWLPQFDALRPEYVERMLEGIVNFQIAVTRLETRWKLSQNRSRREQELIAEQLERSGDSVERALAALTRKHLPGE